MEKLLYGLIPVLRSQHEAIRQHQDDRPCKLLLYGLHQLAERRTSIYDHRSGFQAAHTKARYMHLCFGHPICMDRVDLVQTQYILETCFLEFHGTAALEQLMSCVTPFVQLLDCVALLAQLPDCVAPLAQLPDCEAPSRRCLAVQPPSRSRWAVTV